MISLKRKEIVVSLMCAVSVGALIGITQGANPNYVWFYRSLWIGTLIMGCVAVIILGLHKTRSGRFRFQYWIKAAFGKG